MRWVTGLVASGALLAAGRGVPAQDGGPPATDVQKAIAADDKTNEGKRLANDKKFDDARAAYQEALKIKPDHFWALYYYGESYASEANMTAALPWFAKASDADPSHFLATYTAGNGFRRQKQWDKALPFLKRAVEAAKGKDPVALAAGSDQSEELITLRLYFIHAEIVESLWDGGKKAEVEAAAKEAIKVTPQHPNPYLYLGMLAEDKGEVMEAINWYERGAKCRPDQEKLPSGNTYIAAYHSFGVECHTNTCQTRAVRAKDSIPRYGDVKGDTFTDSQKELKVTKPLKSRQWNYIFTPHEAKQGSVVTHVISMARYGTGIQSNIEAEFVIYGAATTVTLNLEGGGTLKPGEPEKLAEDWKADLLKNFVDIVDEPKIKVRKGDPIFGPKSFYYEFKGVQRNHAQRAAEVRSEGGQLPAGFPQPWESRCWVVKGKKNTFWMHLLLREDIYKFKKKELDREVDALMRSVQFPK
ncbi:MAG: tetratricopeptide repeat protein [Planctomycetales bacterium]|nr:tetratricopeptide repeat protein [Planctomycetales bacterium]